MDKTKRRLSAIVVLTSVLLLGVLALSTGIASEDSSPLNDWDGTWLNVGTMLDDPAMDAVYEAMTDAANAAAGDGTFTTDDAKSFLYAMHKSSFGDLGIAENNITYYNTDGTVKCECEYESAGVETVAFGEEEFNWYKFALTSEDAACSEYRYLIFTEVHSHEGGMVHWHMRYGNTSFDDLINNTNYAIWYPTFAVEGTTMETVADGYAEGAEMMGGMMLASQESIVPAERIYGLARHLEAAVEAVHDGGVHVIEDAKGEFEKYKVEIQQAIGIIRGSAHGVEQRRAELYDITKDLEGEHVEAIHNIAGDYEEPVDKLLTLARQLDALKDDPVANEEGILEIAGKLHGHLHAGLEGPARRMVRRAEALGYEAPVSGKEMVWEYTDVVYPVVVERLENGNTLIVDAAKESKRAIEVTRDKEIVWEYPAMTFCARRLPNGNTLIAGPFPKEYGEVVSASVTEVTPDGEIAWQYTGDFIPAGVDRLANGNTVIADSLHHRLFEVTPNKEIVWEYTDLVYCWSMQVLPNGNMLTIETRDTENSTDTRVVEITRDKAIVWEFSDFDAPFGWVQRLPNGNTVIADSDKHQITEPRIIEVAPNKEIVWEYTDIDLTYPCGVHRLPNGNTLIGDARYPRVIEVGAP
jgi:Zn/Cd-binding protein ZinT